MLEQCLKEIIPNPINKFKQLKDEQKWYFVDDWRKDTRGEMCLYYVVGNNPPKRVVISEVKELLRNCLTRRQITRNDFGAYCHTSNSDGYCAFAVTGRMLEHLCIARYVGGNDGFKIINKSLARAVIGNDNEDSN